MNFYQELDYYWWRFGVLLFVTLLSFAWLHKRGTKAVYYFIPFLLFPFIYAGVGFGWQTCSIDYMWKYFFYFLVFGYTCKVTSKGKLNYEQRYIVNNNILVRYIEKYGGKIICFYVLLKMVSIIANGHLLYIIHPPMADLTSTMENLDVPSGGVSSAIYYIENIIYVFYVVSLYKYRNNMKMMAISILLPVYLGYVDTSYIGRGTMMLTAINLVIAFIYCYPRFKKTIIFIGSIGAPFIIFLLVWYSAYRIGATLDNISISKAIKILSYQETSYPLHYEAISNWGINWDYFYAYIYWIITLPLPGFLKSSDIDVSFNYLFSELINGTTRNSPGFSVSLPGIVNEGVFVFGPTLFVLHAAILGLFVGKTYKLIRYDSELFLFIHCSVNVAYSIARGGTGSQYSFYLKSLLIYLIVRFFILYRDYKRLKLQQKQ